MAHRPLCPSRTIATCLLWPYQMPTIDGWADELVTQVRKLDPEAEVRLRRSVKNGDSDTSNGIKNTVKEVAKRPPPRDPFTKPSNEHVRRIEVQIVLETTVAIEKLADLVNRVPLFNDYRTEGNEPEPKIRVTLDPELQQFAA